MAKELPTQVDPELADTKSDVGKVYGIVMPIASMGEDYPEDHWRRVRKILQRAIERAGMRSQLVWENPEVDVIQSAILQNLYENDVVVCDVSNLNPNVMLETGLRLSTKRPTVIVTDRVVRPPFDISTVGYIEYQKDLEYNAIEDFIQRLSAKLLAVAKAEDDGTYKSFVENFRFETVTPTTVSVPAEEYLKDQLEQIAGSMRRIERQREPARRRSSDDKTVRLTARCTEDQAEQIEDALDMLSGFVVSTVEKLPDERYAIAIPLSVGSKLTKSQAYAIVVKEILSIAPDALD